MLLSGGAIDEVDERGEPIIGDTLLILLNAHTDEVPFRFPALEHDQQWQRLFDTTDAVAADPLFGGDERYPLQGRSVAVFKVTPPIRERRRQGLLTRADQAAEPVGAGH
jgi:glycogen operon protein